MQEKRLWPNQAGNVGGRLRTARGCSCATYPGRGTLHECNSSKFGNPGHNKQFRCGSVAPSRADSSASRRAEHQNRSDCGISRRLGTCPPHANSREYNKRCRPNTTWRWEGSARYRRTLPTTDLDPTLGACRASEAEPLSAS